MKVRFLGDTSKRSVERRVNLVASAAKLSHYDGSIFDVMTASKGYEDDLKVISRITRSGHKSVMEHDYVQIGLSGVTPIVEQTLIGFRLAAFTIKSRRYVDFRKVGYYIPEFRNVDYSIHMENKILRQKYRRHMNSLFKFYSEMVDGGIAKEDARFILPYSFYSDIAMSLNAREFEKMIIYLLYSEATKIAELRELGEKLLEIAHQYVPYIVEHIDNYVYQEKPNECKKRIHDGKYNIEILHKPALMDYTTEPDDVILESAVMSEMQCNYDDAWKMIVEAEKEDPDFRAKYMDNIVKKSENRELEQVSFNLQIPISLSILTHLTRHRMHSLITPSFVPLWNFNHYIIPETIKNSSFLEKYQKFVKKNMQMVDDFKRSGVIEEDLVYFYLGCQMCNVITTMNGRELTWITRMRACNRAQWQIREIANAIINETQKVAPLLSKGLGPTCKVYHYCPEGKLSCGLIKEILKNEKVDK